MKMLATKTIAPAALKPHDATQTHMRPPLVRLAQLKQAMPTLAKPRLVAMHSDHRAPGNFDRLNPSPVTALPSTMVSLLASDTFKALSEHFPLGFISLNHKSILEILTFAQLGCGQNDVLSGAKLYAMDSGQTLSLTQKETQTLAQIIKSAQVFFKTDHIQKLGLAPSAKQLDNLNDFLTQLMPPLTPANTLRLKQTLDAQPLVLNLTQEALQDQKRILDQLLRSPIAAPFFEDANTLCAIADRDTHRTSIMFSPQSAAIITLVAHIILDVYALNSRPDVNSLHWANSPLSHQEQNQIKNSITGTLGQHILSYPAALPAQMTSLTQIMQKNTCSPDQLPHHFGDFTLTLDARGIPYCTTEISPTLDQVEPFLSALFEDPRAFNSADITRAQTFNQPDYTRFALNKEIEAFAAQKLHSALEANTELQFLASKAQVFNDYVTKMQDQGKLDENAINTLKAQVKTFMQHSIAQELDKDRFFQQQPMIIRTSSFAQQVYQSLWSEIAGGEINLGQPLFPQLEQLASRVSLHTLKKIL